MKLYSEELLLTPAEKFSPITFTSNSSWVVPRGIRHIQVDCVGAQGFSLDSSIVGGYGGRVQCYLRVTSGQVLQIVVGTQRTANDQSYNATDIRTSSDLSSRLVVAGGGGNYSSGVYSYSYGGQYLYYSGGNGGGLTGAAGNYGQIWWGAGSGSVYAVAQGGSQSGGGAGAGANATGYVNYDNRTSGSGSLGTGGSGMGNGVNGCGGSGYYGGGGGVAASFIDQNTSGTSVCSGAGGSSYADSSLCSNVVHTQGYKSGNGYVTISMI